MTFTPFQKEVLLKSSLGKIRYRKIFKEEGRLGFSNRGEALYNVYIADDIDKELQSIVLLHEVGHIYYFHLDVNLKEEAKRIKELFEELHKDPSLIAYYGGPVSFINICMDLEVNSKVLTLSNVRDVEASFGLITPESLGVEIQDGFRDYYIPLIEKLGDTKEAEEDLERIFGQKEIPKYISDIDVDMDSLDLEVQNVREEDISDIIEENAEIFEVQENTDKVLRTFLYSFLKTSQTFYSDTLRIYNRQSRKGDLLYTSYKLKPFLIRKKIAFLLDVSSSMNVDSILKALKTLEKSALLNSESTVILYTDRKVAEFPITKIPKSVLIGGTTDMSEGLRYVIKRGFRDCCIYSDFKTDIDKLIFLKQASSIKLYSVVVNNFNEEIKEYLTLNEKYILVK